MAEAAGLACYNSASISRLVEYWLHPLLNKLIIFGVGLIGGSLSLALKKAGAVHQVIGVGRSGDSLQQAVDLGVIDAAASNLALALKDADMVLIATPVAQIPLILQAIAPHLAKETVVTDVGSTKADVVDHARNLLGAKFSQFVGGHPIAGAETSGVTAAQLKLFQGKNVILTPTAETSKPALERVVEVWRKTGAHVIEMPAERHDHIFAAVSHLPHLLAFALVDELAARPNADQLFAFAASGFRDFTRIAGSSPEMWRDISLANRQALLTELSAYQEQLSMLQLMLQNADAAALEALFERASQARNDWAQPSAA